MNSALEQCRDRAIASELWVIVQHDGNRFSLTTLRLHFAVAKELARDHAALPPPRFEAHGGEQDGVGRGAASGHRESARSHLDPHVGTVRSARRRASPADHGGDGAGVHLFKFEAVVTILAGSNFPQGGVQIRSIPAEL
jgi:hypothetical protein